MQQAGGMKMRQAGTRYQDGYGSTAHATTLKAQATWQQANM